MAPADNPFVACSRNSPRLAFTQKPAVYDEEFAKGRDHPLTVDGVLVLGRSIAGEDARGARFVAARRRGTWPLGERASRRDP